MDIIELLFDLLLISIAGLFIAFSPVLIITKLPRKTLFLWRSV